MTPTGYLWYASSSSEDPAAPMSFGPLTTGATSGTWNGGFTPAATYYRWVRAYEDFGGGQIAYSTLTSLGSAVAT